MNILDYLKENNCSIETYEIQHVVSESEYFMAKDEVSEHIKEVFRGRYLELEKQFDDFVLVKYPIKESCVIHQGEFMKIFVQRVDIIDKEE